MTTPHLGKRLDRLEQQHPDGPDVVVYEENYTPETTRQAFPERLAAAQKQAGPHGTVIIVRRGDPEQEGGGERL